MIADLYMITKQISVIYLCFIVDCCISSLFSSPEPKAQVSFSDRNLMLSVLLIVIIPALSKESSGILLLPLSVRPSFRKKSLSLELHLHFKDLRNDTLGSHWVFL